MKKRALIVTEFDRITTNYGNVLQSYALQKFLRDELCIDAETMVSKYFEKNIPTSLIYYYSMFKSRLNKHLRKNKSPDHFLETRKAKFREFEDYYIHYVAYSWDELNASLYDYYIVGSDKVWTQKRSFIDRLRFLDFNIPQNSIKVSYAASFGNDWIPENNIKALSKLLGTFSAISVREKSSVSFLEKIGIQSVQHVLDPSLLLTSNDWGTIEKKPDLLENDDAYVFVYLLELSEEKAILIREWTKKFNMKIVSIPYADGNPNQIDKDFGDILIEDCGPAEWVWLINHAKFVFTDSFHCTAFSSNLNTKFYVFKRDNGNNRLVDYLREIDCERFLISNLTDEPFDWDFDAISKTLNTLRKESILFLRKSLVRNE